MSASSKYTDEFRRETADYTISTGRPVTEVCRELGQGELAIPSGYQLRSLFFHGFIIVATCIKSSAQKPHLQIPNFNF